MTEKCRLCGAETAELFSQRVLGQHDVRYYRCPQCDLIQTEQPYWLEQAYSTTYSALDIGVFYRNQFCSRLTMAVATVLGLPSKTPYLDYGGGHGIFTRLMRDAGWDFYWHDKLGPNLFARGFEGSAQQDQRFVTCFEVFEHFVNVREDLNSIFHLHPEYLLVGTFLHANHSKDWWYFLPESGQHVAFYSRQTMQHIGKTFGYKVLCSDEYVLFMKEGKAPTAWRQAILRRLVNSYWLASSAGFLLRQTRSTSANMYRDHLTVKALISRNDSR